MESKVSSSIDKYYDASSRKREINEGLQQLCVIETETQLTTKSVSCDGGELFKLTSVILN